MTKAKHDTQILQTIQAELRARVGSWPEISEETGIPYPTLSKIGQQLVTNPRIQTVQRLLDYFAKSKSA